MRRISVTNVGTIGCKAVTATIPEDAEDTWEGFQERTVVIADNLAPGDREPRFFFAGFDSFGGSGGSFVITVTALAEDREEITTTASLAQSVIVCR